MSRKNSCCYHGYIIIFLIIGRRSGGGPEVDLKEMGEMSSGMASTVIQLFLRAILESFMHKDVKVRHHVLKVVMLVLAQGLVHPVQVR